jgi:hypothetical protein
MTGDAGEHRPSTNRNDIFGDFDGSHAPDQGPYKDRIQGRKRTCLVPSGRGQTAFQTGAYPLARVAGERRCPAIGICL